MRKFWIGYLFKNWYLPYKLGYAIVITGARTYFKKLEYEGKEKTGVIPDVLITPRLSDVLEGVDAVLGSVLEEIRSSE